MRSIDRVASLNLVLVTIAVLTVNLGGLVAGGSKPKATVTQVSERVLHAEGPFWDAEEGVLYFVDINGRLFNRLDPATGNTTSIKLAKDIGFAIPVSGQSGRFLAGVGHDLVLFDWDGNQQDEVANTTLIATVDQGVGKEGNRFNDAKVDVIGRLWAGTMGDESSGEVVPNLGSLYSLAPSSDVPLKELTDVTVSNGIIWNAANDVMYYIDSPTRKVDALDFYLTAGVTSRRHSIFNLDNFNLRGVPDGMTIDSDGHLWVALWGGRKVIKVDPATSSLLQEVDIPADKVTSVTFGGPQLDTLYVTTSRRDMTSEEQAKQPGAGAVFAIKGLGVRGVPDGNRKVERT